MSESHSSSDMFNEKNIDTFEYEKESTTEADSNKMYLKKKETIATDGSASVNYNFKVRFYNLPSDQSSLMGKNFNAHISIDNVVC